MPEIRIEGVVSKTAFITPEGTSGVDRLDRNLTYNSEVLMHEDIIHSISDNYQQIVKQARAMRDTALAIEKERHARVVMRLTSK